MTPIDQIELSSSVIQALRGAGLVHVEQLCAMTVREVRRIDGLPSGLQDVRDIRSALGKLGMDLRQSFEDPVGQPVSPSRKALRGLFDSLELMPDTRKAFTLYLLKATTREELLSQIDAEDNGTIIRLLKLIDECQSGK